MRVNRCFPRRFFCGLVFFAVAGLIAGAVPAQPPVEEPGALPEDFAAIPDAAFDEALDLPDGLAGGAGFGQDESAVVSVSAVVTAPADDRPAELYVTATMAPGWHIYSITQPRGGPIRTEIKRDLPPGVRLAGPFRPTEPPQRKREPAFDNLIVETHEGTVTWRAPLEIHPGVELQTLKITGAVYAQPCSEACLMPKDYAFTAVLGEAPEAVGASTAAAPLEDGAEGRRYDDLTAVVGLAFLGGLILNLMPCVLPVISLKLFSFVQQGGESRGRVFLLNVWYALGLVFVFMILATLAAAFGMAWGELFTLPWFKIAMTALVFVMALSFLGVWELPIPGLVGSGAAGRLQAEEGVQGAFA